MSVVCFASCVFAVGDVRPTRSDPGPPAAPAKLHARSTQQGLGKQLVAMHSGLRSTSKIRIGTGSHQHNDAMIQPFIIVFAGKRGRFTQATSAAAKKQVFERHEELYSKLAGGNEAVAGVIKSCVHATKSKCQGMALGPKPMSWNNLTNNVHFS